MKKLVVLLMLPWLTACPGGGDANPKITTNLSPEIEAPEVTTTTLPVTTTTTQAPALDYNHLQSKVLTHANGQITVGSGRVLDTRCGFNYAVTSHSSVAGVVTIVTEFAVPEDYTPPGHEDCIIYPTFNRANQKLTSDCPYSGPLVNITTTMKVGTARAEYRIESVNGGYQVDRKLRTRTWWSQCHVANEPVYFEVSFPTEMYNE